MKVRMQRMWINQPSTLQYHHDLHGTNVLAAEERPGTYVAYFLDGFTVSMEVAKSTLSPGWVLKKAPA